MRNSLQLHDPAYVSKLAAQVSLPYKKSEEPQIVRTNGTLSVRFVAGGDGLPYGKYPRLMEMWITTMIKTGNDCYDPRTRTMKLGGTFRAFMRLIGAEIGGNSMKQWRAQLERLFGCSYVITNNNDAESHGAAFTVASEWHIDWLRSEPQEDALFENTVVLTQGYVAKLEENPVPINLRIVAELTKPMALDIYAWLTRRYSYLREPQSISWQQLSEQFGSTSATMKRFRQSFKRALADVQTVYPQAKVVCGRKMITLFPSATSVPTAREKAATRVSARMERKAARTAKESLSEADITEALSYIENLGDDYLPIRRRIIALLKSGYSPREVSNQIEKERK